jgi:hypothetical protein
MSLDSLAARPARRVAGAVLVLALALAPALAGPPPASAGLLVPMDGRQSDHLRAYGFAYWCLEQGHRVDWLLNYRGGSFLAPDDPALAREASIRGVSVEPLSPAEETDVLASIEDENMERVILEKAPRVAVYVPPTAQPWDDAVRLALEYAQIPYRALWDREVLAGELSQYDWLHLHHEDFTGQQGKFFAAYRDFVWYQEEKQAQEEMAAALGFGKVWELKQAVAQRIQAYVAQGGFLFAMCSATDTYDIALAAAGVDIVDVPYDGDPPARGAQQRLDFSRALAFRSFRLITDPFVYEYSDIDATQQTAARGPLSTFTLFEFSAKNDPVPSMLTQCHVPAVPEFLGQTTAFRRSLLKPGTVVLAETPGTEEVKYLHGNYGRGTFTFLGGHDPEDYQHAVGDPPTELSLHKSSPGYRLILNNVLFPAAEKKKQRT